MSLTERASKDRGFSERYTLGDRLGVGGMGEVYRGIHRALGRDVAIKFLVPELARDQQSRQRFEDEARLASKLLDPNVVVVFDFGIANEVPYLVTELVTGRPLSDMIGGEARLPGRDILSIAQQMLDGLAAIHGIGIIHRDFKPENILVIPGKPPKVKIADFGIAKEQGGTGVSKTNAGMVMGTPAYMAPEQALGDPLSPGTDLYAFSLILYVMVVGHHPLKTGTAYETVRRQVLEVPRIPPEIPRPIAAVLTRGLAKSPAERYRTARELKEDLQRCDPDSLDRAAGTPVSHERFVEAPAKLARIETEKPRVQGTIASTQFEAIPEGPAKGTLGMEMGLDLIEAAREDTFPEDEPAAPLQLPTMPSPVVARPLPEPASPRPEITPARPSGQAPPEKPPAPYRPSSSAAAAAIRIGGADPAYRPSTELTMIRPKPGRPWLFPTLAVTFLTIGLAAFGLLQLRGSEDLAPPSLESWPEMAPVVDAVLEPSPKGAAIPEDPIFMGLELCLEAQADRLAGRTPGGTGVEGVLATLPASGDREAALATLWGTALCLEALPDLTMEEEAVERWASLGPAHERLVTKITSSGKLAKASLLQPGGPVQRLGWILTLLGDPKTPELVAALQGLMGTARAATLDREIVLQVISVTLVSLGYTGASPLPDPDVEKLPGPGTHPHLRAFYGKVNTGVASIFMRRIQEGRHDTGRLQRMLLMAQILHELEVRAGGKGWALDAQPAMPVARLEQVPGFPADLAQRILHDLGPGVPLDLAAAVKLPPARLHELAGFLASPMVQYLVKKVPTN